VAALACTEAECARQIITRVAEGASGRSIARWLSSLGVPAPKRYRDKSGRVRETLHHDWAPDRIWDMVRNPMYRGVRVWHYASGDVEQPVPSLVDDATWHRAATRIGVNQALSLGPAKYTYLLRGKVVCGACGGSMQGNYQVRVGRLYYSCGKNPGRVGERLGRCASGYFRGEPIEGLVLSELDAVIENPGPALDELRSQVRDRLGSAAMLVEQTRALHGRLAETEAAKHDVMALVRRRRISVDEADAELATIADDAARVRRELDLLASQSDLAGALEAQLLDTSRLLAEIREEWRHWRTTNDRPRLAEVISRLVLDVRVLPGGETIRRYAFGQPSTNAAYSHDHGAQIRRAAKR
jgi:hypothetical protein